MPIILSFHRGQPEVLRNKAGKFSAIRKAPIEGPLNVSSHGITGDMQVDRRYHGGEWKALCSYASEYYPEWFRMTGNEMPAGSFGENLHTQGLLDGQVCLGDVYRIGRSVRAQVTGPRGPCSNLGAHWDSTKIHLECKRTRKTGFYLRVLEEGETFAGDTMVLEERHWAAWTLPRVWDVADGVEGGAAELAEMIAIDAIDPMLRDDLVRKRERLLR